MADPSEAAPTRQHNRRPLSAPLRRQADFVGMTSSSCLNSKEFHFGSSELVESNGIVSTSRMPTATHVGAAVAEQLQQSLQRSTQRPTSATVRSNGHHGALHGGNSVHRGPSQIQSSFYRDIPNSVSKVVGRHLQALHDDDTSVKEVLSQKVAERVAAIQSRRDLFQRRLRPATQQQSELFVKGENNNQLFHVGFDSRTTILDAAKSACLANAPVPSQHTATREGRPQHSPLRAAQDYSIHNSHTAAVTEQEEGGLMLAHRKAEMMLSSGSVPSIGAGLRAVLLASEDRVFDVAGGILPIAQVLAFDVAAHHEMQQMRRADRMHSPYKDVTGAASGGGESWRIVHNGTKLDQSISPPLHPHGATPFDFDDIVNGSAVRIRGRPHSAPLQRPTSASSSSQKDYLEISKKSAKLTPATSPAAAKGSAVVAAPSAKLIAKHHVAATAAAPVFVEEKPKVPEWLDSRGLIGVSVDPRYQPHSNGVGGPSAFQHVSTVRSGGGGGIDGCAAAGMSLLGIGVGKVPQRQDEQRLGHYTSYSSSTAVSAIREAKAKKGSVGGVLRGGAGFLMFTK